ncbi:hypothetical protein K458DRAFT_148666 [Lentithecium fluviatile CBS 122367]|uniref:Uncharacterized protein n=1 Tax=Lentithecium fluviatile CBS 122367 TaxID=1168545 RepID=A0A6G1JE32_9PLEO|nr:hypothetical protein K458DRAFT_148666 [Lentithecium fluviatile CBS 122367]
MRAHSRTPRNLPRNHTSSLHPRVRCIRMSSLPRPPRCHRSPTRRPKSFLGHSTNTGLACIRPIPQDRLSRKRNPARKWNHRALLLGR